MKSCLMVCLLATTPLVMAAEPVVKKADVKKPVDPVAAKPLMGKWIVRSVHHDGKPTGAQIGQAPGDIINIENFNGGLFLG